MNAEKKHDISAIFYSRLGWLGVTWVEDVVQRLVFAYPRRNDVAMVLQASPERRTLSPDQSELVSRLKDFADGHPVDFSDVVVALSNRTPFQQAVLRQCRRLPWGSTSTYGQLARATGRPGAARAVGAAMARNPIPIIIPCHRVVPSSGKDVGGFSAPGGNALKRKMLTQEGIEGFSIR